MVPKHQSSPKLERNLRRMTKSLTRNPRQRRRKGNWSIAKRGQLLRLKQRRYRRRKNPNKLINKNKGASNITTTPKPPTKTKRVPTRLKEEVRRHLKVVPLMPLLETRAGSDQGSS